MFLRIKDLFSKNKIGKNDNLDISNNKNNKKVVKQDGETNIYNEIDYREKYLDLKQENIELKQIITELKNDFNYNHYYFSIPSGDLNGIMLEKRLNSKGIKKYIRKMPEKGWSINYYVHKDEWLKFMECIEEYNKERSD